MTSTVTAFFDSRSDAEAAKERLKSAQIDADHVHVHDRSSAGFSDHAHSTHEDRGIWESVKNAFLPDDDRHSYEEGIRRGGAVLTADVDDDRVDEAVRILEQANSVDIDDRTKEWRASGWNYPSAGTDRGSTSAFAFGEGQGDRGQISGDNRQEEIIPVVEEQLVVGKRDVARGGVRVRSYVTETPVHEQVRLRNERVEIERRPVDRALSDANADAFRERTIDMTATGEEAVVGKTARVVEEVVVSKTSEERVEDVSDTVRRTDVEVDRDADRDTRSGSVFGSDDKRI